MEIIYNQQSIDNLTSIKKFIQKVDSTRSANKFISSIKKQIKTISFMPYKYRKSLYYNNKDVRDMIFKGYTIVYYIKINQIIIVEIFRQRNY